MVLVCLRAGAQPPTLACKTETKNMEYMHIALTSLHVWHQIVCSDAVLMNKISAQEPSRKFMKYCWLGADTSLTLCQWKKKFFFCKIYNLSLHFFFATAAGRNALSGRQELLPREEKKKTKEAKTFLILMELCGSHILSPHTHITDKGKSNNNNNNQQPWNMVGEKGGGGRGEKGLSSSSSTGVHLNPFFSLEDTSPPLYTLLQTTLLLHLPPPPFLPANERTTDEKKGVAKL